MLWQHYLWARLVAKQYRLRDHKHTSLVLTWVALVIPCVTSIHTRPEVAVCDQPTRTEATS